MPNPAHSAFWDDQESWDDQADLDDRLGRHDRFAGQHRSAGHDRSAGLDRTVGHNRAGWHDGYRDRVSAATYWRRRAVALVIGLAVLGVIAWAVNGVLGGGKAASQPPSPTGTHAQSHGGAENLSGTHAKAHRHARHKAHAVGLGPQQGASTAATTSAVTGPGSAPPACAPGSVVLTLRSPSYWYLPRARPVFVVEAVSTRSQACEFNLGARFVSVLVTSGPAAIWNSANCVPAPGSRLVVLRRGVPAFFRTTWDRRASPLGCRGHGDLAKPGTYTAVARDDHLRSQTMVFVLSGRGVAVP